MFSKAGRRKEEGIEVGELDSLLLQTDFIWEDPRAERPIRKYLVVW